MNSGCGGNSFHGALSRLLRPRSIAVIGGGSWSAQVINQSLNMGFSGPIWAVHPSADTVAGQPAFRSIDDLPDGPDAAFVGVNRHATLEIVRSLSQRGAGGAVCFASGFREAVAEDAAGADLQARLLDAAGPMPILGPNCYGFINYLDGALLWPDQHGGERVEQGVAVITQSSNIAINLTMQRRALPLAYVVTSGNQAQCGFAEIGTCLIEDPRVTALGLHIEGIGDLRSFEALADRARALGKPIVALKVGRSAQARAATLSHTASLAGAAEGARALLSRLGIAQVASLPEFLETLKLMHVTGWLPSHRVASISCSGGEASLAADTGQDLGLDFPPLNARQSSDLRTALGPMVALANPLDYHTYIWRDTQAMARAFSAMVDPCLAMTLLIADFPREDRCDPSDWDCVIEAAVETRRQTGGNLAVVSTLPETMPEPVARTLFQAGVVPFCGLDTALSACAVAVKPATESPAPVLLPGTGVEARLVPEFDAKQRMAASGLRVPLGARCSADTAAETARAIGFPVVLKAEGLAHKTEAGAVVLNLTCAEDVAEAVRRMPKGPLMVEEMVPGGVVELLVGVVRDPAHGFLLTLAAGGIHTEVMDDRVSVLIPSSEAAIERALDSLRISRVMNGYRGAPGVGRAAIHQAVQAIQTYVLANSDGLEEIEVNPLICAPQGAVAADVLLRQKD